MKNPEVGDWVIYDYEILTVTKVEDLRFSGEHNSTTFYKLSKNRRGIEHNVSGGFRFPAVSDIGDRLQEWQDTRERKSTSEKMVGKTIASVNEPDDNGDICIEFTDGTTLRIGVYFGQDLPTLEMDDREAIR